MLLRLKVFIAQLSREDSDALQAHVRRLERKDGATVAVEAGTVGLRYYAVAVVDRMDNVCVLLHQYLAPLCEQRLEVFWIARGKCQLGQNSTDGSANGALSAAGTTEV